MPNYLETLQQLERLLKTDVDEDGTALILLYDEELKVLRRLINNEINDVAVEFYTKETLMSHIEQTLTQWVRPYYLDDSVQCNKVSIDKIRDDIDFALSGLWARQDLMTEQVKVRVSDLIDLWAEIQNRI